MSDNVRRDNRRALPKYLLTILLFGLLGKCHTAGHQHHGCHHYNCLFHSFKN